MTGSAADADDLVQDAYVRALHYAGHAEGIEDWRAYLTRIMRNLIADEHKRRARRGPHVPLDDVEGLLSVRADQFESVRLAEMDRALAALPESQREVLLLVSVEGWSYEDAAAELDLPVGTVMSRLHRGRNALRESLADGAGDRAPRSAGSAMS